MQSALSHDILRAVLEAYRDYNSVNDERVTVRDDFSMWSAEPDNVGGRLMAIVALTREVRHTVGITRGSTR